jgi:hypothetical protein
VASTVPAPAAGAAASSAIPWVPPQAASSGIQTSALRRATSAAAARPSAAATSSTAQFGPSARDGARAVSTGTNDEAATTVSRSGQAAGRAGGGGDASPLADSLATAVPPPTSTMASNGTSQPMCRCRDTR